MMTVTTKEAWKIATKKKSERTVLERVKLSDWVNKWICPPIRVLIFPFALLVRLYRWTYWEE